MKHPFTLLSTLLLAPLVALHAADVDLRKPVRIETGLRGEIARPTVEQ